VGRALRIGAALAVALAALSLALPYEPVYDPWGWLVWGRELAGLDLATGDGLSWKPLPVLIDAPLSLLGDAAPRGWLLVARSGWLLAVVLAGWLAARLASPEAGAWRLVAAALAAGSVALTADSFTPPTRQFVGGLSEPLLVALVLGAVAAALERRDALALWLGVLASLLRPECWPFLAIWAVWALRRRPELRPHGLALLLVPLAWFVPDLLGSGDPLRGAGTARGDGIEVGEALEVLGRALAAPLAAAWAGVALLWVGRRGRREQSDDDRAAPLLLAGAAAWVALVAVMAVAGYAGLPRFLAPATAVVAVLGGAGIARAGAAAFSGPGVGVPPTLGGRRGLTAGAVAALLLASAGLGLRAAEVPGDLRESRRQAVAIEGLSDLTERLSTARLLSCGGAVRLANLLAPPTALAWQLEEPIGSVRVNPRPLYGVALSTRRLPRGRELARVGPWRATQLPCPGPSR
jgi:MFS family permease